MSNNGTFIYLLSFNFQQPSLISHGSLWTAERSLVWHWIKCVGLSTPLPGWYGTITLLLLSICLCCTNTALNHNCPNPICLVQYQFNLGFIPPVSYCHVQLLQTISRKGKIFPHLQMSFTNIFQNTNTHFCGYRDTTISFLNISCRDLEKWEQFLKSDYKKGFVLFCFSFL